MAVDVLVDRLNKIIEIQEKNKTKDTYGGFTEQWVKLLNCWAEIKPLTVNNIFEANKINEKITYIITIRFNSKIKSNQRIKYKDRIFNIKNIINFMEENKIMEITAEEEIVNN